MVEWMLSILMVISVGSAIAAWIVFTPLLWVHRERHQVRCNRLGRRANRRTQKKDR